MLRNKNKYNFSLFVGISLFLIVLLALAYVDFRSTHEVPLPQYTKVTTKEVSVEVATSTTTLPEPTVSVSTTTSEAPALPIRITEAKLIEPEVHLITTPPIPPALSTTSKPIISKPSRFSIQKMLDAHNEVRKGVGLTALTWSNTLALSATKWGDTLVDQDCKPYHEPSIPYGENLYWSWISLSDNDSLISTPQEAVKWWANEVKIYNYEKNTCKTGKDCGHYTQIVWRETTEVGCGVSTCFDGDIQTDIWVCRYNPPGNDGTQPY